MLPDVDNLQSFAALVLEAITQSNWRYVAALVVVAVVGLGGKLLSTKLPFFATPRGKAVLTIATCLAGGLSTAFAAGKVPGTQELLAALGVGWTASGGFSQVKALFEAPKS